MLRWRMTLALLLLSTLLPAPAWMSPPADTETSFQVGNTAYTVGGETTAMDVAPYVDDNGRTLVPVRFLAKAIGVLDSDIIWDEEAQAVRLQRGDKSILLIVGDPTIWVDGIPAGSMDTAPMITNGRMFLPIRYVAEVFGHGIDWDGETRKIKVGAQGTGKAPTLGPLKPSAALPTGGGAEKAGVQPGTAAPRPNAGTLIWTAEYKDGFLVGVQGDGWYLALSGEYPSVLRITDGAGERSYAVKDQAWRRDPVVMARGLDALLTKTVADFKKRYDDQRQQRSMQIIEQQMRRQQEFEQIRLRQEMQRQQQEQQRQQQEATRQQNEMRRQQDELRRQQQDMQPQFQTPKIYTPPPTYTPPKTYTPPPTYTPPRFEPPPRTRW